jgi:hypothetical protein
LHGPGDCTTNAPYPFAHPEPVSNGEWNDVVRFVHPNGGSHYITIEIDGVIEDPVKTWFIF